MRQVYKSFTSFLLLLITFLVISTGCSVRLIRELSDPSLMTRSDTTREDVKIHMKDGSLYVADSLIVFDNSDTIEAYGSYYSPYRNMINSNITSSGLYNSLGCSAKHYHFHILHY
jgi:hypothetical protein